MFHINIKIKTFIVKKLFTMDNYYYIIINIEEIKTKEKHY
ncbi:hypothetical protein SC08_Contig83orf00477 [Clostridium butyricum]|nr:hypothetical protein SC08_Contig83orf00477 [Clostridium butyricum]